MSLEFLQTLLQQVIEIMEKTNKLMKEKSSYSTMTLITLIFEDWLVQLIDKSRNSPLFHKNQVVDCFKINLEKVLEESLVVNEMCKCYFIHLN